MKHPATSRASPRSSPSCARSCEARDLAESPARVGRINRWWIENRDARDLFVRELADAEIHLRAAPESEVWRKRGDRVIRRWLLPKTGYHLYYQYDATQKHLLVLAAWGATRGTTPRL